MSTNTSVVSLVSNIKPHIYVPTSTVIARHKKNPYLVTTLVPVEKHKNRNVACGGRIEPDQTPETCIVTEYEQEMGGKGSFIENVRLFAIRTDATGDIRVNPKVTLGKLSFDQCPEENRSLQVAGHYGVPDHIFIADVEGEPSPNDHEAKECVWVDIRKIVVTATEEESTFGAQHDLVLIVYRLYLAGRDVEVDDFVDLNQLRRKLPALIEAYERRWTLRRIAGKIRRFFHPAI